MTNVKASRKVYFYPHGYLRDRHLDTIRTWPRESVLNPEIATSRVANQVPRHTSLARNLAVGTSVPLINLKLRPRGLPTDAVVFVSGALMVTGPYIVELDNPYALTRYNLDAVRVYRGLIRRMLLKDRCQEIRCISGACRETLGALFGREVHAKAEVHYPRLPAIPAAAPEVTSACRFLFISTQFEIKAGPTVLRAFREVHQRYPESTLDAVTHLPDEYRQLAGDCPGITIHPARYSREEIWTRFMQHTDVIVHPTFVESFGMVVLEALAHGLGVIATDVYALGEMVTSNVNGMLITPPLSIWDGYLPSRHFRELSTIKTTIRNLDDTQLQRDLVSAMSRFAGDGDFRRRAREASLTLFRERFAAGSVLEPARGVDSQ